MVHVFCFLLHRGEFPIHQKNPVKDSSVERITQCLVWAFYSRSKMEGWSCSSVSVKYFQNNGLKVKLDGCRFKRAVETCFAGGFQKH